MTPAGADARLAHARALQKTGEQRAAISAYHEALRLGAAAAEVNLQLGVIHAALGEHADATSHLERVLAEQPENGDALCMLGTVVYDQGQLDQAARCVKRALVVRPRFPEALFNLGLAQFETGDLRSAADCIERCFSQNRGEPWPHDAAKALAFDPQPPFPPRDMAVNRTKLHHDCEQLEYLLALGRLPAKVHRVLADYRALLAELPEIGDPSMVAPFDAARPPLVARTYKRPSPVD